MTKENNLSDYNWLQRGIIAVIMPIFKLVFRLRVEGLENIPAGGPAILMINHVNFFDPVVLIAGVRRRIVPMSKIENLKLPGVNWLIHVWGAINVRRGEVDRAALRQAIQVLQAGGLLMVAPEGTRSKSGELQEPREGVAYLATRTGALVIPTAIVGTPAISHNLKRFRRTDASVTFGRPFYFEAVGERAGREVLAQMTHEAMYQLAAMLPPQQRGRFANLREATTRLLRLTCGNNLPAQDAA